MESRGEKNASDDVLVVDDDVSELDFLWVSSSSVVVLSDLDGLRRRRRSGVSPLLSVTNDRLLILLS